MSSVGNPPSLMSGEASFWVEPPRCVGRKMAEGRREMTHHFVHTHTRHHPPTNIHLHSSSLLLLPPPFLILFMRGSEKEVGGGGGGGKETGLQMRLHHHHRRQGTKEEEKAIKEGEERAYI